MNARNRLPAIVVVGCGAAAREFCLPVLCRRRDARRRIVLVDVDTRRAETTARELGIDHWCDDVRCLPLDVDAAIITTPHHLHAEQACHFLSQGRHVLVEKPLGMTRRETDQMVESADRQGAVLMVNNYRRLFPAYRRVKELLQARTLGDLRRIAIHDGTRFAWASASGFYLRDPRARGVLFDRGAHTIDVLQWWLGGLPELRSVRTDAMGGVEAVAHVELQWRDVPIDVRFSRLERLENRYHIECEQGTIEGRLFDFARFNVIRNGKTETVKLSPSLSYAEWSWRLVENFVEVVLGRAAPLFEGKDVRPSIGLLEQAYQVAQPFELPWYDRDPNVE